MRVLVGCSTATTMDPSLMTTLDFLTETVLTRICLVTEPLLY
jgi:hypothetical protein